ncbi:MAG: YARHG domain-containing protein [Leptolyngbyaceae cyanobacterium RU_5_1]|nr:YARHG domain-containing protein [Leptolyngbyaceae cyanobacterium RU_5_1]
MIRPSTPETLPPERSAPATLTSEHTVYSPTSTERTTQLPAQDTTQPPTPVKHTTHPHPKIQNPKSKIQAAVSSTTTRERRLTQADLQGRSARELTIMRNEIYARHGRKFYEPELKSHFEQQSWYRPRYISAEFPVSLLSEIEMHNAILIREYQFDHGLWD